MNVEFVGNLAQTRQTWRNKPVRELYADIVAANPNATEDMLRKRFREHAIADSDYLNAIIDYAFDAASRAYERHSDAMPQTAKQRADRAAKKADELKAHAARVEFIKEQIILLNQEMPNGKRARFCTLDYMYRLGGAFRSIGKQGSQKLVGSVYDESSYRRKLHGVV